MHAGTPFADDYLLGRVGVGFFSSERQLYAGCDGSVRLQVPQLAISPFAGLGAYIGDIKKCTISTTTYIEECEKKFLIAGYTELGLSYSVLQLFWRNYNINRAGVEIPSDQFWGLGIAIPF